MSRRNLRTVYREQYKYQEFTFNRRRYGLVAFLFDLFMIAITQWLWLIWIFIREMRRR